MKRPTGRVFVDPGHGGADPGAVYGELREVDITLPASLMLAAALHAEGLDVMMTPAVALKSTETIRARARARWCNDHKSGTGRDLVVSIHCNASELHKAEGSETWYYSQSALASDLAYAIAIDPTRNRGAKRSTGLSILADTHMAAVLLELGFVDGEPTWLKQNWNKQIEAIVPVICSWMAL